MFIQPSGPNAPGAHEGQCRVCRQSWYCDCLELNSGHVCRRCHQAENQRFWGDPNRMVRKRALVNAMHDARSVALSGQPQRQGDTNVTQGGIRMPEPILTQEMIELETTLVLLQQTCVFQLFSKKSPKTVRKTSKN